MHEGTKLTREFEIDVTRSAVDTKRRTVELSFSSEEPVERWFGTEILDHSPGAVDLSRIDGSGALLVDHDSRDQVGVVESARIGADRKGRAKVRFGKSSRAEEIFQDVVDGIRKLVSVGYRINKTITETAEKGLETIRAVNWTPLEISLVGVPADMSVGVGRSMRERHTMSDDNDLTRAERRAPLQADFARREGEQAERERVSQISAIADRLEGRVPGIREMAKRAIQTGASVEQLRADAMAHMPECKPIRAAQPLDVNPKDWARYSVTRAIKCQMDGRLDGFEAEMSQEVSHRTGRNPTGFWIPGEALREQRSYVAATGTLGGMLVSTPTDGTQFIELLRNRAAVVTLGARVVNLDTPVQIPRQSGAGTANWVGETVAATLSPGNFTQITLSPKGVSAFQQYSKQLLVTNNPSIDQLVRDDINQILALAIDYAALHGAGGTEPTGLAGTTGVGTVNLATNGQGLANATAYPAMVSLETALSVGNADVAAMGFILNAQARGALRVAQRFADTDTPVYDAGQVLGYRAEVSNQIATNLTTGTATTICTAVFFGNWSDLIIGQFNGGATDLVVDPYTLAVNGVVRLIARRWVDIGVRHPASFAILGGVR